MKPSITGIRRIAAALTVVTVMAAPALGHDVYLVAQQFTKTMPDATPIDMWGFAPANASFVPTGPATVPGPVITVPAGDSTLNIHLKNELTTQGVSIVIPGQRAALSPVRTAPDVDGRTRVTSFTNETAPGGTTTYMWSNFKPGTYLYQSGSNPAVQVPMGLYGAVTRDAGTAGQAYPAKPYDNQVLLLFSEIDPALNAAVIGGTFGTPAYPSAIKFEPTYFLINGQPHPSATAVPSHPIVTGERVLLRLLNAGVKSHQPTLNGLSMTVIAEDGNLYPYARDQYSLLLPAGKTADAYLGGGGSGAIAVFDRALALANAGAAPGGMVTNLSVAPFVRDVCVNASNNDAEESASGSVSLTSGDLELVEDQTPSNTQKVGIRFTGVNVPQGAVIGRAYVQFRVDEVTTGATNLTVAGHAAGNPGAFTTAANNISSLTTRPRTTAQVSWSNVASWPTIGAAGGDQQTPELKTIVQEIVNRGDWAANNAVVFIITGSGRRTAESYDGLVAGAPCLHVEYSIANPLAQPTTTTTSTTTTSSTTTTTAPPGAFIFEKRIATNSDDAEQSSSGSVDTGSGDLDFPRDGSSSPQTVGLRWTGVTIPVGATITNAYVQFQVDEVSTSGTPILKIEGQAHVTSNPPTFTSSSNSISNRLRTTTSVTWTPAVWPTVGVAGMAQQTSNLTTVIQELIGRPGWNGNNPLVLIITNMSGTGTRVAESRDGTTSGAPLLHIEYSTGGTTTTTSSTTTTTTTITGSTTTTTTTITGSTTTTTATVTTTTTTGSTTTTTSPATVTFEKRIASNSDDAEESSGGSVTTDSGDLELVQEDTTQKVGLRWTGVTIPVGATITNAYVRFQVDESTSNSPPPATLTIKGQVHPTNNPPTFSSSNKISTRPLTTNSIVWTPGAWPTVGASGLAQQTSPSLAAVIQEIVNGAGWSGNNPLVLIITGSGKRVAESRDGTTSGAPLLHIEYTP